MAKTDESDGGNTELSCGAYFVKNFKLVAVKTISWAHDDESPKETVTFEYGGLQIRYSQQKSDGSLMTPIAAGWNKVTNKPDTSGDALITS